MRGRSRGHQERIILLAHQTEMMARQKTLKPVKHYMPKSQAAQTGGAAALLAKFRLIKARQDAKEGQSEAGA